MSTATRPPETSPLAAARAPGRLRGVLLVLALLVAVGGLVLAAVTDTPTSAEDDVREVAASLRCLACAGEDVANSTAPLAESMRLVIAEQRAAGRSPEQIREWFVSRYGPEVLLDPPRYDVGLLLWIAPLLVVAGAAGAVVWRTRTGPSRGRSLLVAVTAALVCVAVMLGAWAATTALRASPPTPPAATDAGDTPGATRVLHDAVGQDPANTRLRTALATRLETEQRYAEAAEQYAALGRLRPLDASVHYRQGFALFRADDLDGAAAALEQARLAEPDHAESLLLLGTIRQGQNDPEAVTLLRRFVEVAPEHTAAGPIRTWLAEHDGTPES